MGLFERCFEFSKKIDYLKSQNKFFYMREVNPPSTPVVTLNGVKMLMFGSNNYLGLANHPKVIEAAINATRTYGTGTCSSRILTGTSSLHTQLERKLAEFKGTEDAVVFSTGFMTMMGTIAALTSEDDIIFSDALNHASIIEGCRLSKAQVKVYRHNDMASLEEELAQCPSHSNKLIVTDGVFSMKGTVANLPAIKRLANTYNARIMVDDAHGSGVLGARGRGILEHFNMEGHIDLVCGTFSKSFGCIGGFTGAKSEVVTFLKLNARPFIFSASPPVSLMATVLACLEVLEEEPDRIQKLHRNSDFMKKGLKELGFEIEQTITPIIPILIGDDDTTFKMAGGLQQEGIIVNPVVSPAVPERASIIRVSVMASFSLDELTQALDKFKKVGKRLGIL